MKNYLIFLIIYWMGIRNCIAQRAFEMENLKKYLPPPNQRFIVSKHYFKLDDTSVVSPNAYYVRTNEEQEWENYKIVRSIFSYIFMRFYSDGKVFFSFQYLSLPTRKELDDTTYGKFGRYIVEDSILKVELYQDKHDKWQFLYAYLVPEGIQFYKLSTRGWFLRATKKTKDGGYYRKYYF